MYQPDQNNSTDESGEGFKGVTTHSRIKPLSTDPLYILGNGISFKNHQLFYKYFPLITGRSSKLLYTMLLIIYSNPLRNITTIRDMSMSNSDTSRKNLDILIDMGYIQQENKPRKVIPFQAYVLDKVYRITVKGVKALSAVTGY